MSGRGRGVGSGPVRAGGRGASAAYTSALRRRLAQLCPATFKPAAPIPVRPDPPFSLTSRNTRPQTALSTAPPCSRSHLSRELDSPLLFRIWRAYSSSVCTASAAPLEVSTSAAVASRGVRSPSNKRATSGDDIGAREGVESTMSGAQRVGEGRLASADGAGG